MSNIGSE